MSLITVTGHWHSAPDSARKIVFGLPGQLIAPRSQSRRRNGHACNGRGQGHQLRRCLKDLHLAPGRLLDAPAIAPWLAKGGAFLNSSDPCPSHRLDVLSGYTKMAIALPFLSADVPINA